VATAAISPTMNAQNITTTSTVPSSAISSPLQINIQAGLTSGNYILLLLYRRDLMRVKIQITSKTIQLTLCSKLIFDYTLGDASSIVITSTNTPNSQCKTANESIYFNYLISAVKYSVDSDGLITLIDATNKSIVSLVLQ
jgi:hypothetical protein